MKHQLFKKGTYVEIDTNRPHLIVLGKVGDATIVNKPIKAASVFNIPQQSIELEPKLLIIQENPEITPKFVDDIIFIKDIIKEFDGISYDLGKLYSAIVDLDVPSDELKQMFYKLNQGAK